MNKALKFIWIIFLTTMIFSCSNILNYILTPFAPEFLPELKKVNGEIVIYGELNTERITDDDGDWTEGYALYIYRSTQSPYEGWRLVGRYYNPGALGTYNNISYERVYDESSESFETVQVSTPQDFSLSRLENADETVLNINMNSQPAFVDTNAPSGTLYYRISVMNLVRSSTVRSVGDEDYTFISYSINHDETSGWSSIEK